MWPVKPDRITLRVCADMDWQVTLGCPKCQVSTTIHASKLTAEPFGSVPLYKLLADKAFKCRKVHYGCSGTPANRVTVSCIDVGTLKQVAEWER